MANTLRVVWAATKVVVPFILLGVLLFRLTTGDLDGFTQTLYTVYATVLAIALVSLLYLSKMSLSTVFSGMLKD